MVKQRITNADGDMKVYTQFHDNPSNSCWDTSHKTTNTYPIVANKTEDHKSLRFIMLKPGMSVESGNSCSRCKDISQNCRNVELLVVIHKKSGGDLDSS